MLVIPGLWRRQDAIVVGPAAAFAVLATITLDAPGLWDLEFSFHVNVAGVTQYNISYYVEETVVPVTEMWRTLVAVGGSAAGASFYAAPYRVRIAVPNATHRAVISTENGAPAGTTIRALVGGQPTGIILETKAIAITPRITAHGLDILKLGGSSVY